MKKRRAHRTDADRPPDVLFKMVIGKWISQAISAAEAQAAAVAYDFKGIGTLMDVAGGHGLLLATALRRHKTVQGVLFDLPHVVAGVSDIHTCRRCGQSEDCKR